MQNRHYISNLASAVTLAVLMAWNSPARARQQEPAASPPSNQQAPDAKDGSGASAKKKPADKQGKSKLEQETGTVNDRIFEVMPNYGMVEGAGDLPRLTTGQKFRLATAGVFDYFTYPFIGSLAAIGQANNSPKSWGQGWGAYGKRFGASFGDNGIGTYMTTAVFPSLLREDPRYYQKGKGSVGRRALYSIGRLFIARTDSGRRRFNFSEIVGNAAAGGISNIYHPPEDRTLSRNLTTWGMLIMWDGVSNEMKEFWPDIRRKVFRKNSP
ncbi:MAG TPA: hypothetical protein VEU31_05800 [Candidatus Acidoferrales bacterium]|nr:hypothetical protein [Candidatus Acidoferrales bacterium]